MTADARPKLAKIDLDMAYDGAPPVVEAAE